MDKKVPTSTDKDFDKDAMNANKGKMRAKKVDLKYFGIKVQQSRDELVLEQTSESAGVQHKGILIEKGIMECTNQKLCEAIGDSKNETAQLTKDELVEQIMSSCPQYAQLRGILMEKGIRHSSDCVAHQFGKFAEFQLESAQNEVEEAAGNEQKNAANIFEEMKYVLQLSSDVNNAYLKELLIEKGLMESWVRESEIKTHGKKPYETEETEIQKNEKELKTEEVAKCNNIKSTKNTEVAKIINDINQLTENLERNPEHIDWQQFHSNLLKIHKFYLENLDKTEAREGDTKASSSNLEKKPDSENANIFEALTQVEFDIEDMMEPLKRLIARSRTLNYNIQGIETIISSIDQKVEQFYRKYYQTLLQREKSYKDMIGLQTMRKTIGKRLSQVELEIFESKTRLLKRGVQNK